MKIKKNRIKSTPVSVPAAAAAPARVAPRSNTPPVAPMVPASGTWLVTPEVATAYLGRNTHNRNLSPRRVADLAAEIREGRWLYTHQGIAFAATGVLVDGQHRLSAIVEAGIGAAMQVTCGLDAAAVNVIDTGRSRTAADTLRMAGRHHATLVASIMSVENQVQHCDAHQALSNAKLIEMLAANPDVDDAADAISLVKNELSGWMPLSVIGWWYWRAMRVAPDLAQNFLDQVARGLGLEYGSPALAIRNRFSATRQSTAQRAARPYAIYMLCSAWASFCAGEPQMKSQVPKDGNPLSKLYGPGMQQ